MLEEIECKAEISVILMCLLVCNWSYLASYFRVILAHFSSSSYYRGVKGGDAAAAAFLGIMIIIVISGIIFLTSPLVCYWH